MSAKRGDKAVTVKKYELDSPDGFIFSSAEDFWILSNKTGQVLISVIKQK